MIICYGVFLGDLQDVKVMGNTAFNYSNYSFELVLPLLCEDIHLLRAV